MNPCMFNWLAEEFNFYLQTIKIFCHYRLSVKSKWSTVRLRNCNWNSPCSHNTPMLCQLCWFANYLLAQLEVLVLTVQVLDGLGQGNWRLTSVLKCSDYLPAFCSGSLLWNVWDGQVRRPRFSQHSPPSCGNHRKSNLPPSLLTVQKLVRTNSFQRAFEGSLSWPLFKIYLGDFFLMGLIYLLVL